MVFFTADYISVGGNRHPSAADWDCHTGVLAFGAGNNVALWDPLSKSHQGVYSTLVGHSDKINAVKFYKYPTTDAQLLLTGSVDRSIRIWQCQAADLRSFAHVHTLKGHEGSINTIAAADNGLEIFTSGAADGTIRVWKVPPKLQSQAQESKDEGIAEEGDDDLLAETISLRPRFFPLAMALRRIESRQSTTSAAALLAVGGTMNRVQIYVAENISATKVNFRLCTTLAGHEAWVRSLAFRVDGQSNTGDLLLSSASQDKYVRLWRVHERAGDDTAASTVQADDGNDDDDLIPLMNGATVLSNKAHEFELGGSKFSVTFEALLLGHEDWVYTTAWNPDPSRMQLLSASADNTLTIWEPDPFSGLWVPAVRMGELSVQKGSTTATGSTGGFWIGLWSPEGARKVVSLGRTGSWRSWDYDEGSDMWVQSLGISGHVRSVNGIEWVEDKPPEATDASAGYLLSTGSDQTTRLHAKWIREDGGESWHEFSRPQIHGYDLNCVASLGPSRFVSGADEKLLRVFNEPRPVAQLLEKLSGRSENRTVGEGLPDTAQIPVLGLSNKAMNDETGPLVDQEDDAAISDKNQPSVTLPLDQPPLEDYLARYTLWPELEKLYGHGYEISAVAASHDRSLIATACKASSLDHAVIRLYATSDWHEIKPSLAAHSLTVTSVSFSEDDRYLLSVGRDRQWAVFQRARENPLQFELLVSNPKAHSRMILDAAWAPGLPDKRVFATAARDKSVKIWQMSSDGEGDATATGQPAFTHQTTISLEHSATAVAFMRQAQSGCFYLAIGEDSGALSVHSIASDSLQPCKVAAVDMLISPSRTVTDISWRPFHCLGRRRHGEDDDASSVTDERFELAVASEDTTLRVYSIWKLLS